MCEEERREVGEEVVPAGGAAGTERRRSRSGVPAAGALPEGASPAPVEVFCRSDSEDGEVLNGDPLAPDLEEGEVGPSYGSYNSGLGFSTPLGSFLGQAEKDAKTIRQYGGGKSGRGRRLVKQPRSRGVKYPSEHRILVLDVWKRSGLPCKEFSRIVGISVSTLGLWKRRFEEEGLEGLSDAVRGAPKGSRLPEVTKRAILMIKESHPEYGCQRISDMLARGESLSASAGAISKVLHEAGYQLEEEYTKPHKDKIQRFERDNPNELWQTDLFTFLLKRQNRRVYLVVFMDDHSRFIVGYGLQTSPSTAMVIEVMRSAIASFQRPEEVLTDNGPQYISWRKKKSIFTKECKKQGIIQTVSAPRHPKTLGKVERFWKSLWEELLEAAIFVDLEDARHRIGLFIDYYNFQRPHQGVKGLVPADRYFGAESAIKKTMQDRIQANAFDIARHGIPKKPFYLTGQVDGKPVSLHQEGERIFLMQEGAKREEVKLVTPQGWINDPSEKENTKQELVEGKDTSTPVCPDVN